jgi:hypothetical protein
LKWANDNNAKPVFRSNAAAYLKSLEGTVLVQNDNDDIPF